MNRSGTRLRRTVRHGAAAVAVLCQLSGFALPLRAQATPAPATATTQPVVDSTLIAERSYDQTHHRRTIIPLVVGGVIGAVAGGFVGLLGAALCDTPQCSKNAGGPALLALVVGAGVGTLLGAAAREIPRIVRSIGH